MAKRGMLPKFRPAQLGRDASPRPTIRPVKASPPPPPPSPPRRMSSGFSPKGMAAAAAALAPLDSEGDRATAIASYGDPATLDRANAHSHHANARNDEELPSTTAVPRGRVDAMLVSFEDETQARQPDDRLLDGMRGEPTLAPYTQPAAQQPADMNVPYDSLPSLEVRRPYDTYEAAFAERDPVTAMHAQHDSAHVRRAEPATYPAETRSPETSTPVVKLPSFRESFSSIGADSAAYDQRAFNDPDFNARAPRHDVYDDGAYREPAPPVNDYDPGVETEAPPAWNARREESGPRERPRNDYEPAHSSPPWNGRDLPYDMHDAGASRMVDPVVSRMHDEPAPTGFSTMPPSPEMAPLARESYPAPEPYIPPAPRVPAEARGAAPFVMGVQPIRQNANRTDAWPPAPVMMPMQAAPQQHYGHLPSPMQAMQMQQHGSSMPPAYAQPQYVNASPRVMASTPQPGSLSPQVMPHAHPSQRGQQHMGTMAAPPNRIGRFAWFVAGVAFGITFAIFATGFFGPGSAAAPKAASEPPPAAQPAPPPAQTAAAAPAVTTAAPAAAPVPPPPPVGTVATTTPSALPAAGAAGAHAAPAAPATPAVTPKPAPVAKAPPVVRRSTPSSRRQFNAPATSEAKPVRSGGDDEGGGGGGGRAPAPPPEAGDLLGAALR